MRARTEHDDDRGRRPSGRGSSTGPPISWHEVRFELVLLAACSAVWLLAVLGFFGILPIAGLLRLDFYRLFSIAGVLGWIAGNIYVVRRRGLPGRRWHKRLLLAYLLGPSGVPYLLRSMAPPSAQAAAPLVPLLSLAVYGIFFLVPVTLRRTGRRASL